MEKLINNAPFALVLVFLVIGFILLIKGADFFVEGSSSVAKRLHVPSIIIGLTIVAMGTSLPETAVSVSASLAGNNELAVSNVVGSNIFNLMVVIGVCAMIATVEVARETIRRDIPLSLICAGLLLLLGTIGLGDQAKMTLGHFDGVIFIGLFAGYIFYMVKIALKANKEGKKVEIEGGSAVLPHGHHGRTPGHRLFPPPGRKPADAHQKPPAAGNTPGPPVFFLQHAHHQ